MRSAAGVGPQRRVLPPRGLFFSLAAQVPAIVWSWPLHFNPILIVLATMLATLGITLNLTAVHDFARHRVSVPPFGETPQLVVRGPYRFSRNPMYLGLVALSATPVVGTGVWWNAYALIVYWAWLHFSYVRPEEVFLRRKFGAAFDNYALQTPRWLFFKGSAHTTSRADRP